MLVEKRFKGEVEINYAEGPGNGLPLLFLHGTMNRWQAFLRHIPWFTGRWHVYAPDYRGHGKSGRAENYGYPLYYRDTVQFMEEVMGGPAVIFGHSLGGRLALRLAAERPDLVRAIILGDSSLNDPAPSTRMGDMFGGMIPVLEENKDVKGIYEALKEGAGAGFDPVYTLVRAKNLSQVDVELLRGLVKYAGDLASPYGHFTGYKPSEHLAKVSCPVLIIQAEKGMLKDEDVERALGILPEAYHLKLMGMPHEFLTRDTEPVVDAVTAFLETLL